MKLLWDNLAPIFNSTNEEAKRQIEKRFNICTASSSSPPLHIPTHHLQAGENASLRLLACDFGKVIQPYLGDKNDRWLLGITASGVYRSWFTTPRSKGCKCASLSNTSKLPHKLTIDSQISLKSSSPLTDPLGNPPLFSLEPGSPVFPWLISRFLDKRSLF